MIAQSQHDPLQKISRIRDQTFRFSIANPCRQLYVQRIIIPLVIWLFPSEPSISGCQKWTPINLRSPQSAINRRGCKQTIKLIKCPLRPEERGDKVSRRGISFQKSEPVYASFNPHRLQIPPGIRPRYQTHSFLLHLPPLPNTSGYTISVHFAPKARTVHPLKRQHNV